MIRDPDTGRFVRDPELATVREMHEETEAWSEKLSEFRHEVERRFGRLEKAIIVLGIFVVLPKVGGPSAAGLAQHVATVVAHI